MLSSARNSLFKHPKRVATVFGVTSTSILLILTCIKLTPLGKNQRHAKKNRDHAKKKRDAALQNLNSINAHIQENRQRIKDLDCAIDGYETFNQNAITFLKRINDSSLSSMDRLESFWKIHFLPDKTIKDRFITQKYWKEYEHHQELIYSCTAICPAGQECCNVLQDVVRETTYYYNEITTIQNVFKNILTGSPLQLSALNCGYYSRQFETYPPVNYMRFQTPHIESGDRRTGTTYVDFSRGYGSKQSILYKLDDRDVKSDFEVLGDTNQDQAAINLAARLYAFLGTAVAAFGATGANYPVLQDGFRREIPLLLNDSIAANTTLQQQNALLAEKQIAFDKVNRVFKNDLAVWLPLLIILPTVTALLIYFVLSRCKDVLNPDNRAAPIRNERREPNSNVPEERPLLLLTSTYRPT